MTDSDLDPKAKNAARARLYRAGYRSPWGKGRPPNATNRALAAARRLLDNILDDSAGWSVFGAELDDEGQEAANALSIALAEINEAKFHR